MTDEDKRLAFLEAVKPLMQYLSDYHHPHTIAIIRGNSAEVLEGVFVFKTEEFTKD